MRDDDLHQPLRQTAATMLRQNECVRHPGEGRVIRHDARETDLILAFVNTKRQRIFNRALHHLARATFTPVRLIADEVVNQIEIKAGTICADRVFAALPRAGHERVRTRSGSDGINRLLCVHMIRSLPLPVLTLTSARYRCANKTTDQLMEDQSQADESFRPPVRDAWSRDSPHVAFDRRGASSWDRRSTS